MIAPHHPVKPSKPFTTDWNTWYDYVFVSTYRSCWIWHVVSDRNRRPPEEFRYVVECPDETTYFARNLTEAKIIAGRWSNGDDPQIPEEI